MDGLNTVVIGLGSNLGDRSLYLQRAVEQMVLRVGVLEKSSSVCETESWGFEAPPFLNQIVVMRTALEPIVLLDVLQSIERELGRERKSAVVDGKTVYHNRTIDLDILDYAGIRYADERLTLPHPLVHQRDFVMKQLQELEIEL